MKKTIHILSLMTLGLMPLLVSGCAPEKQVEYADEKSGNGKTPVGPERRKFTYEAMLTRSTALTLADATAFSMDLEDCASTQEVTVTETNVYLELYEFDRNCVVKLTQFTLNGNVYTPKSGATFTTWAAGDIATFTAGAGDDLRVEVMTTISNPVAAGGTIHYQFSEITQGATSTIGEAVVRESQVLTVNGQAAPNFTIGAISLVDITADGNGEFRFQLHCAQAITGSAATTACYDVRLADIRLMLVEDEYSGVLTQSDLDTIYAANAGGKSILASDYIAAGGGSPALVRGGFITANTGNANVMVMPTAKPIHAHPNMILILKAGPSYLYFNVDVTTITQDGSPI